MLSEMELEMRQETKTFETHDLYLASALKIHGFKIVDIRRNGSGRGIFVFEDQANRFDLVKNYFSGDLSGSLKAFSNAWADLKSLVSEMEMEKRDGQPTPF